MDARVYSQDKEAVKDSKAPEPGYQVIPHNIEAEQELLGAILINNRAFDAVSDIITDDHFYEPIHQRIYRKVAGQIHAGREATPVTLKEFFSNDEPIGDVTVPQYLGRLAASATSIINAPSYAETIKGLYARRRAIYAAETLLNQSYDMSDTPVEQAIETAQSTLDQLTDHGGTNKNTQSSLAESALDVINELKHPTQHNAISTSLKDLDKVLCGGWPRGELVIVAARPSVGKSAFITSTMLRTARQGYEVLCFSMEMSKKALAARCLSDITYTASNPINYSDILRGTVEDWHFDRLETAQKIFADFALAIDDQRGLSIANLQSRIRQHMNRLDKEGRKLDLIVIDHLGKIKANEYAGQRHLELGAMTEQLAVIASNYDVAVVVLCQLNRGLEGRDNKRPTLADLRESGRIEEDANTVIGLHRPAYYLERLKCDDPDEETFRLEQLEKNKHKFEAIVLKQRNGQCRPVQLWCNMATNTIANAGRM